MKRFEYTVQMNLLTDHLNQYGNNGFELISVIKPKDDFYFYFKKQI